MPKRVRQNNKVTDDTISTLTNNSDDLEANNHEVNKIFFINSFRLPFRYTAYQYVYMYLF